MNSNPSCEWLLLIPTPFELKIARPFLAAVTDTDDTVVANCGFGPVAAAGSTSHFIAKHRPKRVMLLGIAGSYSDDLGIGNAFEFGSVSLHGVGVGSGVDFQSAESLGWKQWQSDHSQLGDSLVFDTSKSRGLLTVCAASKDLQEAGHKQAANPSTHAEDMEGFGVAMACRINGYDHLTIIRGISNRAGDRNKDNWQIENAIKSACELAVPLLKGKG